MSQYATGLIATTGCPSGEVQTWLRIGDYKKALASAAEFRDIFGAGNYFVELMDHGLGIETRVRGDLLRLAKDLQLPMVATNDLHYTDAADADTHEALLCVQSGKTLDDPNRFKFDARDFYLKSPAEMRALWDGKYQLREACDNTLLIAERCAVSFDEAASYMPRFPVPAGETEQTLVRQGGGAGPGGAVPGRDPAGGRQAGRLRGRRHHRDELPRLLPGGRRLHQLGQGQRHPGRPRPRGPAPGRWSRTRCGSPT